MKSQTLLVLCLSILMYSSCSKSSSDTPPPAPPTPPTPPTIKDSVDITSIKTSYYSKEVTEFPILTSAMSKSLYVGRIIKESDTSNMYTTLSNPVTDTNYINKVTIYTTLPTDSISRTDFPSYALNQSYFNGILKNNNSDQYENFAFVETPKNANYQFRFNQFRDLVGINKDMNQYLGLGFSDTTAVDKKNKVVYLKLELTKFSINSEPPIYTDFIKIPKTNSNYINMFGTGQPKIVASISYGVSYSLAIMIDSSQTKALTTAVTDLKMQMGNIQSMDYNNLSAADKDVFKKAKAYIVVLGKDQNSYSTAESAVMELLSDYKKVENDLHNGGYPIRYSMSNVYDYANYKQTFNIAQYQEVTERVPKS